MTTVCLLQGAAFTFSVGWLPSMHRMKTGFQNLLKYGRFHGAQTSSAQENGGSTFSGRSNMADRKYTHGLKISEAGHGTVLDIGNMEIWDGADLSLIRDTLFRLVLQEGEEAVTIDMHAVQYVPSGFFGMLFDWMERGVTVRLSNPRERVRQMLWFRRFFQPEDGMVFRLHNGTRIDEHQSEDLWAFQETRQEARMMNAGYSSRSVVTSVS